MSELVAAGLTLTAGTATLVDGASFRLRPRELVALLGPNGAGKTSLLRASLGIQKRSGGEATLGGRDSERLSPAARARLVSYLPQARSIAWPNVVRDIVALGRFSHGASIGALRAADREAVERALEACDLAHLANRRSDTLSGGELARLHCARAFAAEAPLLVADEPVGGLDPFHQFRVMDITKAFVDRGGGALIVLHDVALAARYANRLLWMKDGCIVARGTPQETLSAERLAAIYGVRARVDGLRVALEGAA
ncbi:MAG: ABC transporter ATP-binding protein [Rhodospirillales bacterium]|nr:ABC transporter ATP-binding protein [Rhodospirillales bacterium]